MVKIYVIYENKGEYDTAYEDYKFATKNKKLAETLMKECDFGYHEVELID
jgi:hypothetical protein